MGIFLRRAHRSRHTRYNYKLNLYYFKYVFCYYQHFKFRFENCVCVHTSAITVQLMTRVDTGRRIDLPRPRTGVVTTSSRSSGVSSSIMTRTGGCGSLGLGCRPRCSWNFSKIRISRRREILWISLWQFTISGDDFWKPTVVHDSFYGGALRFRYLLRNCVREPQFSPYIYGEMKSKFMNYYRAVFIVGSYYYWS